MRSERRPSRVEQLNVPTGKPDWTGAEQGQQRAPEVRPRPRRAGVTLGRDPKPPEPPRGDGNGHERGLSRADAEKWRRESPELCGRRTKTLKAQLRRMASNGRAPDQGEGSQGLRLEGRTGGQPWCRPGPAKVAAGVAVSGILFWGPVLGSCFLRGEAEIQNAPHVAVRGALQSCAPVLSGLFDLDGRRALRAGQVERVA
jgi:hypothetical protein